MTGIRPITLILALIFIIGCITAPEAPLEKVEINLVFPNGTIEENGTYILGDFKENFSFKVEPGDAAVYFNGTQLNVINGEFVISVDEGGEYQLKIREKDIEKIYKVSIGHGEIMAEWILPAPKGRDSKHYTLILYDIYRGIAGTFKVSYEDGTPAKNRSMIIASSWREPSVHYSINDTVEKVYGSLEISTDSNGIASFVDGRVALTGTLSYIVFDKKTRRVLLQYNAESTYSGPVE